ncbi:D-alanyl-D-alanine carboxypeptidase family protein [Aquisalibacillus elongatus]|uniref:D-alanyl-D-alanine carboxypeptidase n=1 Tax=Aquisalibacillus elongatus TaxID=485577 RepID=A0A3N5BFT6_9BACI|nr:D-alanyl-D-alanine carboxypeptidase family protein [Aquisalibacillus elongatus]RPF55729.1 D-alanyl-D-alanine carboxypeptidase [Aquisalibacillus elongatus]
MKNALMIILVFTLLFLTTVPSETEVTPSISAENAVVLDMDTNEIIFEKNANQQKNIASITKIMTAIVALEQEEIKDRVLISRNAAMKEGSSIYTKPGDIYTLEDLIYGLMLRSGNDAATAIAEHVGGSVKGFAFLMNQKATWIGMNNSSFQNPHGLDEENHYSTAYDMALLTSYAMSTNSDFRKIFGTKKHLPENINYYWFNKNKMLMTNDYCTGGKTGFTKSAGRTLVTTAERNGEQIVVVTLNASSDWQDHRTLYDYGFKALEDQSDPIDEEILDFPQFIESYFDVIHRMHGVRQWSI